MQKKTFSYSLFHIGCFTFNGLGFVMSLPQWIMISVATIWLVALGFHLRDCKEDIRRAWLAVMGRGHPNPVLESWDEFDLLPLKHAACMWHGYPPSDKHLDKPEVMNEIARLSLAVKQRKLEHRNGDAYHAFVMLYNLNVENDQFSRSALRQYAESSGRRVPEFLT